MTYFRAPKTVNRSLNKDKMDRAIGRIFLIYQPQSIAPLILWLSEDKIGIKTCYITVMHN